jgi:hypothetical protein
LSTAVAYADGSVRVDASTAQLPRALASRLALDDRFHDVMDHLMSHLDATVSLRIDGDGAALLEVSGESESRHVRTAVTPTPGPRPVAVPRRSPVRERWSGRARLAGDAVEVRFSSWQPASTPIPVDVLWRCTPSTFAVEGAALRAFACQSRQRMTTREGAGHHVPAYLQIALPLAPPAARLAVRASSETDANHATTGRIDALAHATR